MKTFYTKRRLPSAASIENTSEKTIIEKMGITAGEFQEIQAVYGVSATRLLELMQLSKYPFVFPARTAGLCDPCKPQVRKGGFYAMLGN